MTPQPGVRTATGTQSWRTLYLSAGISSIAFVLLLIIALIRLGPRTSPA